VNPSLAATCQRWQGVEQAQQSGQKSLVTKLDDHKTELKHLGSVAFQIFMG